MNIKELINKLFKSETKNYGLALPTDLVSVPMRDSLDDKKIKKLEEYKSDYLEILAQKKHFTSHDICSRDFNQEMLMNFELFGRLIANHDDIYNLDTMADYEKKELSLKQMINPRKIELYIDKMNAMFNETHLRLVALKEIYSEIGKKLSSDKQNAILNEIYNLTSKYIIFKNNVYAALKEIETYKTEITTGSIIKNETIENDVLNMHESDLTSFASYFIPKTYNTIEKSDLDAFDKMAYLERELEIYAYNHLKIDDLNQELEYIDKIEKTPNNRKLLLEMINELEVKYLVLNDYGGHELDLKPLYEVKFDILTIDIVNQGESPFKNIPAGREFKYYEDIILDKLTTNITGIDSLLNQRLPDDKKYLINYIVELLKWNNLNLTFILQSTFSLSLVLSAASDNEMNYFFNNYLLDFDNVNLPYNFAKEKPSFGAVIMKDKLPLSTVCWLNHLYILLIKHDQGIISGDTNRIVEIYNYFHNKEIEDSLQYKIPEGIKCFVTPPSPYCYLISQEILELSKGKKLVMPDSLKTLEIRCGFKAEQKSSIILNEGLEHIHDSSLIGHMTKELTIPSTLQDAYNSVLTSVLYNPNEQEEDTSIQMEELTFTNCEESITLHDNEQLNKIITRFCEIAINALKLKLRLKLENRDTLEARETILVINPSNIDLKIKPYNIILVYKNGDKKVISIDAIVTIEVLQKMRQLYAKYYGSNDNSYFIDNYYYFFNESLKDEIFNKVKNEIDEILNNEIKTSNKKK